MSTTKEVKALLDELRGKLETDQAAYLEPILRKILEAAKPKTITEVVCRSDPKDKEEIESLRSAVASKDGAIRKLQAKLPGPPPLLDHMSFDERIKEIDKHGRAWCERLEKSAQLASHSDANPRRRKIFLERWLRLSVSTLCNYLRYLESCDRMDGRKLQEIVDESLVRMLNELADDVRSASGLALDLDMPLLDATSRSKVAAAQNMVVIAPGTVASNGAPRAQASAANGHKKPQRSRQRRRPR